MQKVEHSDRVSTEWGSLMHGSRSRSIAQSCGFGDEMKTYTQQLTTNVMEAAIAKYVGYEVNFLESEQWAILDPGDLTDLWADVRAGKQGIADALGLLKVYDELLAQKTQPASDKRDWQQFVEHGGTAAAPATESREVQPTTRESSGRRWYTKDLRTAVFLKYAGYELLNTEPGLRAVFWFAHDNELDDLIMHFNRRELLVEPQAFHDAGFAIRDEMRKAKGYY